MIVPIRHVEHFHRLNQKELLELPKVYDDIMKKFKILKIKLEDGMKPDRYLFMLHCTQEGEYIPDRPPHIHIHFLPYRSGLLSFLILPETIKFNLNRFINRMRRL